MIRCNICHIDRDRCSCPDNYTRNNIKPSGVEETDNNMESTKVQCTCVSKKESQNYNAERPIATQIELQVPYDNNNIYYQLSGGSNFTLNTVNQAAADMFVIGDKYDIVISPSAKTE